jgi:hypothetical protein
MKKYLLGFFALTLAFAMSAFTVPSATKDSWFRLKANQNPTLQSSYELGEDGPICEGGEDDICGVYGVVKSGTDEPDFDQSHTFTHRP